MTTLTHVLSVPLEPRDARAAERLRGALAAMCARDPTLGMEDGPLGEIVVKGISEAQLEWVVLHLEREPGFSFAVGAPEVRYRETIRRPVDWSYTHKQNDPWQYAKLRIQLSPLERGAGIEIEIRCPHDELPPHIPLPQFQDAIDAGIHAACKAGAIAGFQTTDLQALILDAAWHHTDSTAAAFEIAARLCLREALPKAQPWLLEPVMLVVALTPEDFMGEVIGDLNARRGAVQGMDHHGAACAITAMVPLASLFGYDGALRAITHGRGACTLAFDHYEPAPPNGNGGDDFPMAAAVRA